MTDVAQNAVRQYETRKRSRTTPDARALRTTPEARAVRTTPEARAVRKTPEARARRVVRRLTFKNVADSELIWHFDLKMAKGWTQTAQTCVPKLDVWTVFASTVQLSGGQANLNKYAATRATCNCHC